MFESSKTAANCCYCIETLYVELLALAVYMHFLGSNSYMCARSNDCLYNFIANMKMYIVSPFCLAALTNSSID